MTTSMQRTPWPPEGSQGPAAGGGVLSLERVLRVVRRNLGLVLVCVVLVPVAALVVSLLAERRYTASASLLFREDSLQRSLFGDGSGGQADPDRVATTNVKLTSLRVVASRTAAALGRPGLTGERVADKVKLEPEGVSDLLSIRAVDRDPRFAARLANVFGLEYIRFRSDADRATLGEAQRLVQRRLDSLPPTQLQGDEGRELQARARQLELLTSLQTGNAQLVQRATAPASPSSPKPVLNVVFGLFLGLLLAAALTLLREQLDRRLRDLEEVTELFGLPLLASIPTSPRIFSAGDTRSSLPRERDGNPGNVETEAFVMLRTNLNYFNVDDDLQSILIASAVPEDGKTTIAWNLARVEARARKKVLYIEADLRHPKLARRLGMSANPATRRAGELVGLRDTGLSLLLRESLQPASVVRRVDGVDVIPAGPPPPNPPQIPHTQPPHSILNWAHQHYERIIIDTPASTVIADAIPLMKEVSGVAIVVRLRHTPRTAATQLATQLKNLNAPTLGIILNATPLPPSYHDHYPTPPQKPRRDERDLSQDVSPELTAGQAGSYASPPGD